MLAPEQTRLTGAELVRAMHVTSGRLRQVERANSEWQALGYLQHATIERQRRRLWWLTWIAVAYMALATGLVLWLVAVL